MSFLHKGHRPCIKPYILVQLFAVNTTKNFYTSTTSEWLHNVLLQIMGKFLTIKTSAGLEPWRGF